MFEQLTQKVASCQKCNLCSSRTQTVFGCGNPNAKIMFVGEAPGEQEDKTGIPFVGQSGQLLDKMLDKYLGLTRDEVYIANIIKCRPPNNRAPEPVEINECIGYLFEQIEDINPLIIITLGRVAAQTLLASDEKISKLRGRVYTVGERLIVPTWHPSYLLRKPQARWDTVEDMKLVRSILDGQFTSETIDQIPF